MDSATDQQAEVLFGSPTPPNVAAQSTTAADTLFGSTTPSGNQTLTASAQIVASDPPAVSGPPPAAVEPSEALYQKAPEDLPFIQVPPEVAVLREDPGRRIFSAQETLKEDIRDEDFVNAEGVFDPVQSRHAAREAREIAADLGFGPKEVQFLRQRAVAVHGQNFDVAALHDVAVERLNAEYGQGAKQALRDARALLQRDSRVANIIESKGLGNDPDTILMFARAARSQRLAGKLK